MTELHASFSYSFITLSLDLLSCTGVWKPWQSSTWSWLKWNGGRQKTMQPPWSLSCFTYGLHPLLSFEQHKIACLNRQPKPAPQGSFDFLEVIIFSLFAGGRKKLKCLAELSVVRGSNQLCYFAVEKTEFHVRGWAIFTSVKSLKRNMQLERSLLSTDFVMKSFDGAHLEMKEESNREERLLISLQLRQSVPLW